MTKTNLKSQKGRSMVEMLGVLAVIGVLSVGGVYGYGVAMKKHKANELLHQASMLATTISSQILTDKPLNVQDFGDSKYGTFGTPTKVNDEQFTMQITGMDSAVCEQMEKMSGGMVRQAECSETTLTLTYNNNLSSDKVAADYNGDANGENCTGAGYKWCDGLSTPACKKDCCSGITLNTCQESCDSSTGEITPKDDETDCTTADGNEGTCNAGVCEEIEGKTCNTNADCGNDNYFCGYYTQDYGSANTISCQTGPQNNIGKCFKVSDYRASGGNYVWSTKWMDYWSAQNFCQANKKNGVSMTMVSLANNSFQCPYTFSEYNSSSWGYCCTNRNGITSCSGGKSSGIQTAVSDGATVSDNYWYWLEDVYTNNCNAFLIRFSDGYIATNERYKAFHSGSGAGRYAFCE